MKTHQSIVCTLALGICGCLTPPAPRVATTAAGQSAEGIEGSSDVPKAAYRWKSVQILGGGFVTGVVFSPIQKDLVYARTDIGGAYRYNPKDGSWVSLSDQFGRDDANFWGIESLALDPTDPKRLYLACGTYTQEWAGQAAMLWSKDQGATFNVVRTPFKMGGNEDGRSNGERLVVDPNQPRILWFGSRKNGLWTSADQAQNWNVVSSLQVPSDPWGNGVSFVAFDGRSGQAGKATPTMYVGVSNPSASVWVSLDAGTTWTPLLGQPEGLIASHGAVDPQGNLFLTYGNHPGPNNVTNGAVYRFEPKQKRWTDISPLAPSKDDSFGYGGLGLDPSKPTTLVVTTIDRWTKHDEIFRSIDSGKTW